jgi:hypothetical protein
MRFVYQRSAGYAAGKRARRLPSFAFDYLPSGPLPYRVPQSLEFKKSISAGYRSDDPFMRVVPDIRRFCMVTAK